MCDAGPLAIGGVEAAMRRFGVRRGFSGPRRRPTTGWDSLTDTELNVVRLVAERLTNPEIADRLFVSRRTVQTHVSHALAKLGVAQRGGSWLPRPPAAPVGGCESRESASMPSRPSQPSKGAGPLSTTTTPDSGTPRHGADLDVHGTSVSRRRRRYIRHSGGCRQC